MAGAEVRVERKVGRKEEGVGEAFRGASQWQEEGTLSHVGAGPRSPTPAPSLASHSGLWMAPPLPGASVLPMSTPNSVPFPPGLSLLILPPCPCPTHRSPWILGPLPFVLCPGHSP